MGVSATLPELNEWTLYYNLTLKNKRYKNNRNMSRDRHSSQDGHMIIVLELNSIQ